MGFFRVTMGLLFHTSFLGHLLDRSPWRAFFRALLLILFSSLLAAFLATCHESDNIAHVAHGLAENTQGVYDDNGYVVLGNRAKESHLTFLVGDLHARFDYVRSDDVIKTMSAEKFAKHTVGMLATESKALFWVRSGEDAFNYFLFPLREALPYGNGASHGKFATTVEAKTGTGHDMALALQNVTGIPINISQNDATALEAVRQNTESLTAVVLKFCLGEIVFCNYFLDLLTFLIISSFLFAIIEQFRLRHLECVNPFRNALTTTIYSMFPAILVSPIFCSLFPHLIDFQFAFFIIFAVYHIYAMQGVYRMLYSMQQSRKNAGASYAVDDDDDDEQEKK